MVQNKIKDTRRPGALGSKRPAILKPPSKPHHHSQNSNKNLPAGSSSSSSSSTPQQWALPFILQQQLLTLFSSTYSEQLASKELPATLQEIKTALFKREFEQAFGEERLCEAYTVRWSPGRAVGYAGLVVDLREHLQEFGVFRRLKGREAQGGKAHEGKDGKGEAEETTTKVVCLGGGAAETVAFGGALRYLLERSGVIDAETGVVATSTSSPPTDGEDETAEGQGDGDAKSSPLVDLHLIDSAPWGPVTSTLSASLITPPPLSKYASAAARAANHPLLPAGSIAVTFHQADILHLPADELSTILGPRPVVVTLFFTLNELYTTSLSHTTAFLLTLTNCLRTGSVLIVVDSPGSYSEAAVGKAGEGGERKKYPMSWLMDMSLLGTGKKGEEDPVWEKVLGEEARWFRLREGLKYPIALEDMRFQVHVFRRL